MGELLTYLTQKYSKNNAETEDIMRKTKIKNTIVSMCEGYLHEGDELIFEVLPKDLEYALPVFNEEPLKSTVEVSQISETLFSAKLIEIDLGI